MAEVNGVELTRQGKKRTTKRVTRKKRVRRRKKKGKRDTERNGQMPVLCVCVGRQRDRNRDRVAGSTLDYLRC